MDQTLRLAAERVKAWHLERFMAHVEPPEPTQPPPEPATPERVAPITDPQLPGDAPQTETDPAPRRHLMDGVLRPSARPS